MKRTVSKATQKQNEESNYQTAFINRFFECGLNTCSTQQLTLPNGCTIHYFDVTFCDNQFTQDETALLRYMPYEDGQPLLTLTFIPEFLSNPNEALRCVEIIFSSQFFKNFECNSIYNSQPFKSDRSVEQAFTHNLQSRDALDVISVFIDQKHDFIGRIRLEESLLQLLRHSINAFYLPDEANQFPACSFLAYNEEREKILDVQRIIVNQIDTPLTIRELSRMVGMNECYLKKGFKAMFGKSIHEYRQYERIELAKSMLQQKNLSVNEVAFQLGFGSASHFSTSFKKIAGIKPCELLQ